MLQAWEHERGLFTAKKTLEYDNKCDNKDKQNCKTYPC